MAEQGKVQCPVCGSTAKNTEFGQDARNRRMEALKPPKQTVSQVVRALRANRIKRQNERSV